MGTTYNNRRSFDEGHTAATSVLARLAGSLAIYEYGRKFDAGIKCRAYAKTLSALARIGNGRTLFLILSEQRSGATQLLALFEMLRLRLSHSGSRALRSMFG